MAHHADATALMGAREAEHTAHIIKLHWVLQEILRHKLGTQRVAGHNDGLGDVAVLCPNVGRGGFRFIHNRSFIKMRKDTKKIGKSATSHKKLLNN